MNQTYKFLKDYSPTPYSAKTIELKFDIQTDSTIVAATTSYERTSQTQLALVLNGENLDLLSIAIDNTPLTTQDYALTDKTLTIHAPPTHFALTIQNRINPHLNKSLEGLYASSGILCTQCEAEGFRKITYFYDRPDVMSVYTVLIEANAKQYPVLLSNGNLLESGTKGDRHWTKWHDPFPKPCYLFALVAGNLAKLEDSFVTASGKTVQLEIFSEQDTIQRCHHAMTSLKDSMKWDEDRFGRECDLDNYKIVAVGDFNAGAMENKGLNIFNTAYVLADPQTATDNDYEGITAVIGHEYFHNWTGNRITCRDWFQLCLKEGLTVFRDQEFSADISSRAVQRIKEVQYLKLNQFPEDRGPMAHPPRPDRFIEINNFYTSTVYRKGAEVVRMMHTIAGEAAFRRGMDLYFKRHDGQAVTQEDFVKAISDGAGVDLSAFMTWYSQAGTPEVTLDLKFNPQSQTTDLTIAQKTAPTLFQEHKDVVPIPIVLGFLDVHTGKPVNFRLVGETSLTPEKLLVVHEQSKTFHFEGLKAEVVPSFFRHFSAPVKVQYPYTQKELITLMNSDPDAYNSWDAAQNLLTQMLLEQKTNQATIQAFGHYLARDLDDLSLKALSLALPSENLVCQLMKSISIEGLLTAYRLIPKALGDTHQAKLTEEYLRHHEPDDLGLGAQSLGKRAYKNVCLYYLSQTRSDQAWDLTIKQLRKSQTMTDQYAALSVVANWNHPERENILAEYYALWKKNDLLLDRWFSLRARSRLPSCLADVRKLVGDISFHRQNPNRFRALLGSFCRENLTAFHDVSGEGYKLCAEETLKVDQFNPQMAARLVGALSRWKDFDPKRQKLMKSELELILKTSQLSSDVSEVVNRSLCG